MPTKTENPRPKLTPRPRWERRLPRQLVLASTPSTRSFDLQVELQTTDTQEVKSSKALLDSGATGLFIDKSFVEKERLNTRKLSNPIPVTNVDGSPNEAGPITDVVDIILRYKGHYERTLFAVTCTGKEDIILGLPWLREHNPEIDWQTEEVKMSHCPARCTTCRNDGRKEKKEKEAESRRIRRCRTGPMPHPNVTIEDVPEEEDVDEDLPETIELDDDDNDDNDDNDLNKGDRIFIVDLESPQEEIRATSNFST